VDTEEIVKIKFILNNEDFKKIPKLFYQKKKEIWIFLSIFFFYHNLSQIFLS